MASPSAAETSGAKEESSLAAVTSRLKRSQIPHFYRVMTKTAVTQIVSGPFAYALGFPVRFVRAHGTKFVSFAFFRLADGDQAWRVKITAKVDSAGMSQVFAYGPGGWKAFVEDNHVEVGDTLIFSLVGRSNFEIHIIKAARAEQDHEVSCGCSKEARARFVVNVARTDANELRVPRNFWESFRDMLPGRDWELTGPNGTVMVVEAAASPFYEPGQALNIRLKAGWKRFFGDNGFRIGDLLEFSLVAPDCFSVDVHRM